MIDICVGFAGDYLQDHAKGGETKALNDLVKKECHDIVILGSSRAHHHYDTPFLSDTLGMDIYNAGYDGNGVILGYGLLEMIMERYQPKLIIYDIEPHFDVIVYDGDNHHKRYIKKLKPYYRNEIIGSIIKDVSTEEWYKTHSGCIRYNTVIIPLLIDNIKGRSMTPKGYLPLYGSLVSESSSKKKKYTQVDYFKLKYFEKLLKLVNDNHIPMVVVASPMLGVESSAALLPAFKLCYDYQIPVLDYYVDSLFLQHKEWFHDASHLNSIGAREFSKRIVCDIEDHLKKSVSTVQVERHNKMDEQYKNI